MLCQQDSVSVLVWALCWYRFVIVDHAYEGFSVQRAQKSYAHEWIPHAAWS